MEYSPVEIREFDDIWERVPTTELWRCVLAGRLRAVSESDLLVDVANNPVRHWELRRAAINAAGNLPFDAALEKIVPIVMAERSSLVIDQSPHLIAHLHLSWLLLKESRGVLTRFAKGEDWFVEFFGEVLDSWFRDSLTGDAPSGADVARWLHRRLTFHGWPGSRDGPNAILRELHTPILHAAVLRGLRRLGRRDLIEQIIADADSQWLVMRGICEWAKDMNATDGDVARLREAVAKSRYHASPYVGNCMRRFERRPRRAETGTVGSPPKKQSKVTLRFEDACQAIREGHLAHSDDPIIFDLSEKELTDLVGMLGIGRVAQSRWQATEPRPAFTQDGFTVGGARVVDSGDKDIGEVLWPAVAAANRFGLRISWHEASLVGGGVMGGDHRRNRYVKTYLKSLVTNGNASVLYQDCETHPDLLLSDELATEEGQYLIDARAVPHLRRIASSGTDGTMEDICRVASFIPEPAVDPLLCELFARWVRRFQRGSDEIQHARNHLLWRSFSYLRKHPRFEQIPDWDLRLLDLLQLRLAWYNKTDVVEVVAKSPRAYCRLEAMLLHSAPFEHFGRDEVDRLDEAAEALFSLATT